MFAAVPDWTGIAAAELPAMWLPLGLFFATFASEDLACITAGGLVKIAYYVFVMFYLPDNRPELWHIVLFGEMGAIIGIALGIGLATAKRMKAEGATIVRVGQAIFGPRPSKPRQESPCTRAD